ncbi:T-cell surface glycoprotein CD1a isoform X1 [Manis javanica]|uniref:T-cell surface glycoprotein CD1a isoform X1 n=1 Tax=Manis javanica TaxID=9974 RepID=UPI00187A7FBD|nr:T-cell surface glycoprotein CD1a isoform X1 [Manis javanica]
MLFLQLLLVEVVLAGGDNEDAFQEPNSFQAILISSFYNRSWVRNLGSGWLGELQILGWESKSGAITFLWPWSKGNFNMEQWMELEELFHINYITFFHKFQIYVSQWQLEYPFEVQLVGGCKMHSGKNLVSFLKVAYQGSDIMSFQKTSWLPSPEAGSRAQQVTRLFNQYYSTNEGIRKLLSAVCPQFLSGLLDAGKADLQRQVRPEAWLSSGSSAGPGRLKLVCHAAGFYPKPISVMWLRGAQEQQGAQQGDILPNADGTWYLQVSLDVGATEASGLSCRVRHGSLGGQDILLHWGHRISPGWIFLAVVAPLVLLGGLAFWLRRRWAQDRRPHTDFPLEPSSSSPATWLRTHLQTARR